MSELDVQNIVTDLLRRIWRTRAARFNAVRRLRIKERWSTFTLAYLGACSVAVPIVQKFYALTPGGLIDIHYTMLGVGLGIGVIILSLLEGQGHYSVRADRLDRNAVLLGSIYDEFRLKIASLGGSRENLAREIERVQDLYSKALESCPENHEPVDYDMFLIKNDEPDMPGAVQKPRWFPWSVRVRYWGSVIWLYVLLWCLPLAVVARWPFWEGKLS